MGLQQSLSSNGSLDFSPDHSETLRVSTSGEEPSSFLSLLSGEQLASSASEEKASHTEEDQGSDRRGGESSSGLTIGEGLQAKIGMPLEEKEDKEGKRHAQEAHEDMAGGTVSASDDTVTGEAKSPEELTEDDFHNMNSSQGLVVLLGQGKRLVNDVQNTLDGVHAVVGITEVMGRLRQDIRKDVDALNRTITEEYQNIEQLRQLQEAQTAVLQSQLSYLVPLRRSEPAERQAEPVTRVKKSSNSAPSIRFVGFSVVSCISVSVFLSSGVSFFF
ncbi:transmembrane protein [Cystoisospora suis]|uniref:Transmembrane protein n=1 Tax=Cystoisospora suis TaxID=483139 RepID=A0A2C6L5H6_9APIC|nr:transmembrane protein [Cystoisospora suis]